MLNVKSSNALTHIVSQSVPSQQCPRHLSLCTMAYCHDKDALSAFTSFRARGRWRRRPEDQWWRTRAGECANALQRLRRQTWSPQAVWNKSAAALLHSRAGTSGS